MLKQIMATILFLPFLQAHGAESICLEIRNNSAARIITDKKSHAGTIIFNGGYFDHERKPVGYFKQNGTVINPTSKKSISGHVGIDAQGHIHLLDNFKADAHKKYHSIFQSGPFIVDRGGIKGIFRNKNIRQHRMCLILSKSGKLHVLFHPAIDLFDLADYILKTYPDTNMALNLDGGPSCCLEGNGAAIKERTDISYYISITPSPIDKK
ncbi:MAG: phosphodiester glycosidase family protein [Planctomycetes bacterium]|nr:phosphodiester glycosidase family protein [Planctomycetota bacterium]